MGPSFVKNHYKVEQEPFPIICRPPRITHLGDPAALGPLNAPNSRQSLHGAAATHWFWAAFGRRALYTDPA